MMKRKPALIFCLLFIFATCFLTACGEQTAPAEEEEGLGLGDTLKVGMSCDTPPYNWEQEEASEDENAVTLPISGEKTFAGGYDVQIAKAIAEALEVEVEIVKIERGKLLDALEKGDIDLMIAGVNPLESRADRVDFTNSYYDCDYVAVVMKDGSYANATKIKDFDGAKLTAQTDSYIYTDLLPQMDGVEVMDPLPINMDMRVALANGIIDGYVTTRAEGMSATISHPEFAMITFVEDGGFETEDEFATVAIGVTKGREDLVEAVNDILDEISVEKRNVMMDQAIYHQPQDSNEEEENKE